MDANTVLGKLGSFKVVMNVFQVIIPRRRVGEYIYVLLICKQENKHTHANQKNQVMNSPTWLCRPNQNQS